MTDAPLVSVVMPVYNGEQYVRDAIESILNQTFSNFELLIVDDGSTDRTSEILAKYTDRRIALIRNDSNRGLIYSLNRGLKAARGKYIARADADDINLPDRLAIQTAFLDRNSQIGIVGTSIEIIGADGEPSGQSFLYPTESGLVHWLMLFSCCVAHPSVMVRKSVFEELGGYDPDYVHAEDYALWLRALPVTRIANLAEPTVQVRVHGQNISSIKGDVQRNNSYRAVQETVDRMLGEAVSLSQIRMLVNHHYLRGYQDAVQSAELLGKTYKAYMAAGTTSPAIRLQIQLDVAQRMTEFAILCLKKAPFRMLPILIVALRMGPACAALMLRNLARRGLARLARRERNSRALLPTER